MRGTLFIVSAPSGAGKTSLARALLARTAGLAVSISHTTRPMRGAETDGRDYYFVSADRFGQMIRSGAFLEYAEVFGHCYGTARRSVQDQLNSGLDVLLEIDWQGAQQVRKATASVCSIFIVPPSRAALEQRLRQRGQDSEEVIARRLKAAVNEIRHHEEFDYLVVNDRFETALQDLESILRAQRLTASRQSQRLDRVLRELLDMPAG